MSENKKDGPTVEVIVVGTTGAATARAMEALGLRKGIEPPKRVADNIGRDPDLIGEHGCAWTVDIPALIRKLSEGGGPSPVDATVMAWVIEAPWAHPIWHSYALILIHLRPVAGAEEPWLAYEGATHQFMLYALDPNNPRKPYVVGQEPPSVLTPANFAAQRSHPNDAEAMKEMEETIAAILAGQISPDTDWFLVWVQTFGDSMARKVG